MGNTRPMYERVDCHRDDQHLTDPAEWPGEIRRRDDDHCHDDGHAHGREAWRVREIDRLAHRLPERAVACVERERPTDEPGADRGDEEVAHETPAAHEYRAEDQQADRPDREDLVDEADERVRVVRKVRDGADDVHLERRVVAGVDGEAGEQRGADRDAYEVPRSTPARLRQRVAARTGCAAIASGCPGSSSPHGEGALRQPGAGPAGDHAPCRGRSPA